MRDREFYQPPKLYVRTPDERTLLEWCRDHKLPRYACIPLLDSGPLRSIETSPTYDDMVRIVDLNAPARTEKERGVLIAIGRLELAGRVEWVTGTQIRHLADVYARYREELQRRHPTDPEAWRDNPSPPSWMDYLGDEDGGEGEDGGE